jgi:chromosome segregation ATPase
MDVKSSIEQLQEKLRIAKLELKDYKKIIETYRSEIASMQRNLETLNNDNLKSIVPVV